MLPNWKIIRLWILLVFVLGLSITTAYAFVQQSSRSAINTPLIQQLQAVESSLKLGVSPAKILLAPEIDLSKNLNLFITLYSQDAKVIGSSSHLAGKVLSLPMGILMRTKVAGEVRVTWQPTSHLRFASVTDYVPGFGYISVAQSLKEVENQAKRNLRIGGASILVGSLILGAAAILFGGAE